MLEKIKTTVSFIRHKTNFKPEIGVILGTGLGGMVRDMEIRQILYYKDIPYFPESTVDGHNGQLIFGTLGHKSVVVMQG